MLCGLFDNCKNRHFYIKYQKMVKMAENWGFVPYFVPKNRKKAQISACLRGFF